MPTYIVVVVVVVGGGHVFDLADALSGAGYFRILSAAGSGQLVVASLVGVGGVAGVVGGILVVMVLGRLLPQQVAPLARVVASASCTRLVDLSAEGTLPLLGFQGVIVAHLAYLN
jgi:hypothetical protein